MTAPTPSAVRGTLNDYLDASDIMDVPPLTDAAWDAIRQQSGRSLAWKFCTLRNLLVHRGKFVNDANGFAWGGIYRTLFVTSITTTSYRNEGHFRSGERIQGTNDFFFGSFVLPKSASEFRDIVRVVNLRHHVAGVARPTLDGDVRVIDPYEADYAYVATSFIESIRRGLTLCGSSREGDSNQELAWKVAMILYQLAGFTGLKRMPRNLAAHDRFCAAFDQRLREHAPSSRVRRMAQEIAWRIIPFTATMAGTTVAKHVHRHIDPETRELLFPGGEIPEELEQQRQGWQRRRDTTGAVEQIRGRSLKRKELYQRSDVAALRTAYQDAQDEKTDDLVVARLIGAILLHAIDAGKDEKPLERRTVELSAGESLIQEGATVEEMFVVLSSTAPLLARQVDASAPSGDRLLATITAPTVLGEIGMWREKPAVATVASKEPNRLEVLVIDRRRFQILKEEPGFRAAIAAELQRRLAMNAVRVGSLLDDTAARTQDPQLRSIAQLFRYLTGDSHGSLDAVIDLPASATPAECTEALRTQVAAVMATDRLEPELMQHLRNIMTTLG